MSGLTYDEVAAGLVMGIRACLRKLEDGVDTGIADECSDIDPRLYDPRNIEDPRLRAVWNFADFYFDAKFEKHPQMTNTPWPIADSILQDLLERLETGRELPPPESLA